MNVKLAKSAGFCFGVKRAVDLVYDQIGKTEGPIYTYGPIIHNEEVVRELELRGVHVMREDDDIAKYPAGTVHYPLPRRRKGCAGEAGTRGIFPGGCHLSLLC